MSSRRRRRKLLSEINVVPYIDESDESEEEAGEE